MLENANSVKIRLGKPDPKHLNRYFLDQEDARSYGHERYLASDAKEFEMFEHNKLYQDLLKKSV